MTDRRTDNYGKNECVSPPVKVDGDTGLHQFCYLFSFDKDQ